MTERPYFEKSVTIAIRGLADSDPIVVERAAWALSHLQDDRAISALISLRENPDPSVRWAVACGIGGSSRDDAIEALIQLRRIATTKFEIGQRLASGPRIRAALRKRLDATRNEAIWGLSNRRDRDELTLLLSRLSSDSWLSGDEWAAAEALGLDTKTPVDGLCRGLQGLVES